MLIKHKKGIPTQSASSAVNGEENSNEKWIQQSLYLVTEKKKSFISNYIHGFAQANFLVLLSIFIFSDHYCFFFLPSCVCFSFVLIRIWVDFKNQDQIKYATDEATENITNELKGKKFDYFRYRYVIYVYCRYSLPPYYYGFGRKKKCFFFSRSDMRGTHSVCGKNIYIEVRTIKTKSCGVLFVIYTT